MRPDDDVQTIDEDEDDVEKVAEDDEDVSGAYRPNCEHAIDD